MPFPYSRVQVKGARLCLLITFALLGLGQAAWLARLPSARLALGVTSGQLGSLLVAAALGSLVMVLVSGTVVTRFGSARVLFAATVAFAMASCLIAAGIHLPNAPTFAVGLFLLGMSGATANVPINTNAAALERLTGQAIMSQFHAAYSLGAVVGAGLGAGAAHLGMTPDVQLVVTAALVGGVRAVLVGPSCAPTGHLVPVESRAPQNLTPEPTQPPIRTSWASSLRAMLGVWTEPRTLLIGLVIFAGSLSEGSATTWLSIAVVSGFDQEESVGGFVLATFTGAMTVVRMFGPALVTRWGRSRTVIASGVLAAAGLVAFGFGPSLTVAWVGVVAWGAGAALATPLALGAAADDPTRAALRVSVASSFGSAASLVAPPVLGIFIDAVGARHTLAALALAMVVSIAAAPALVSTPSRRPAPPRQPSSCRQYP